MLPLAPDQVPGASLPLPPALQADSGSSLRLGEMPRRKPAANVGRLQVDPTRRLTVFYILVVKVSVPEAEYEKIYLPEVKNVSLKYLKTEPLDITGGAEKVQCGAPSPGADGFNGRI